MASFDEFLAGNKKPLASSSPFFAPQLSSSSQSTTGSAPKPAQQSTKTSSGLFQNITKALSSFGSFAVSSFNKMNEAKFGKADETTGKINTTGSLYGKTVEPALGLAKSAGQGMARLPSQAFLTASEALGGPRTEFPGATTPVTKAIFGEAPIKSAQASTEEMVPTVQKYGVPTKFAPFVAGSIVTADMLTNIAPGVDDMLKGVLKKGVKKLAPKLAESLAKKEAIKFAEKAIKMEVEKAGLKISKKELTEQAEKVVAERIAGIGGKATTGKPFVEPGVKYADNINLNKLNISDEAKGVLRETVDSIKTDVKGIKGAPITHKEVLNLARVVEPLKKTVKRGETLSWEARLTKLRQAVAAGAQGEGLTADFIENVKALQSQAADAGRRLNIFSAGADPSLNTLKEDLVKELVSLGHDTDAILKAAKGYDLTNPKQVSEFYRKFVKPTFLEKMDEYRYINLLSSPKTHIVNAISNLSQAGIVSPLTKLYSGFISEAAQRLPGSIKGKLGIEAQQKFISEVPAYYRGLYDSMGDSLADAVEVFKGNKFIGRPDLNRLPTGSTASKAFGFIPRALEASDVFFQGIIKGGETAALIEKKTKMGKKISEAGMKQIEREASEKAQYFVFRKALDPKNKTGQGNLLSVIDYFTSGVQSLRKPIELQGKTLPNPLGWFVPFIQTPMNIFKQGIEYSPAGFANIAMGGVVDKTEALSKAMIGSTVMAGTAYVLSQTDSTWAAPTGEKEKEIFYASGRQPYSIKLGNQWVSYSKLGVLSYPMAVAGALKYHYEQDPKATDRGDAEKLAKSLGGMAEFFSSQSYMQGLGNALKAAQGDETALKELAVNAPSQLIPLESLLGFVARIIDPVYRKPGNMIESVQKDLPFVSRGVDPYTGPAGEVSERKNVLTNSLLPVGVTPNDPGYDVLYKFNQEYKQYQNVQTQINTLTKQRDVAGVAKLRKENADLLKLGGSLSTFQNSLNALQKKRDTIMSDKILTEVQKKSQVEKINAQIKKQQSLLEKQYSKLKGISKPKSNLVSPFISPQ